MKCIWPKLQMDNSNLVKRQTVKAGKAFQYCTFSPSIFFIWNTFSSHVLYSVHVSFYLNHFFPPMCFIPNMFLFIWSTFFNPCSLFQTYFSIWVTFFHPWFLFQTCFFLFESLFSTHVFYSRHVFSYFNQKFPPMSFIPTMFCIWYWIWYHGWFFMHRKWLK